MKGKLKIYGLAVAVICLAILVNVAVAEPGSQSDPLVSKTYIEEILIPQLEDYVDSRVADSKGDSSEGPSFKVVDVKAGQKVICSAGCEVILRMGSATIIATEKGGLADTTAGFDLSNGTKMPSNHLLIVPLSDGRGVKADTDIILMIKGGYTVK